MLFLLLIPASVDQLHPHPSSLLHRALPLVLIVIAIKLIRSMPSSTPCGFLHTNAILSPSYYPIGLLRGVASLSPDSILIFLIALFLAHVYTVTDLPVQVPHSLFPKEG